jgi:hypothetical protein
MAFNGEIAATALSLPGCALLVRLMAWPATRTRAALYALAGALLAAGALCKQVAAGIVLTGLVLVMWPDGFALRRRALRRKLVAYLLGAALPFATLIGVYAAAGHLDDLYYWMIVYNRDVYMAPYTPELREVSWRSFGLDNPVTLLILAAAAAANLGRSVFGRRGSTWPADLGFSTFVTVSLVVSALAARFTLRDFGHYYVAVMPWMGLLGGLLLEDSLVLTSEGRRFGIDATVTVGVGALLATVCSLRYDQLQREIDATWHRAISTSSHDGVCKFVDQHSKPEDRMVIWGFLPEFYTYCHRIPGTRYPMTTFVAGYVPWFDGASRQEDDQRAAPGARRIFVEELVQLKPAVLLESASSMGGRSIFGYPNIVKYVEDHYCFGQRVDDIALFFRNDTEEPCPDVEGMPSQMQRKSSTEASSSDEAPFAGDEAQAPASDAPATDAPPAQDATDSGSRPGDAGNAPR